MSLASQYPTPFYPDLQVLSASFSTSSAVVVNTKFRQVTGAFAQLLAVGNTSAIASNTGSLNVSANKGAVAVVFLTSAGATSSNYTINLWATGVM